MAVHEKKESFKEHNDRGSILLAFYFVLTLLIPNLVLLYTCLLYTSPSPRDA